MSWPKTEDTVDAIDWSWYQQDSSDGSKPIDVDEFCARNPNIKVAILRACWPNGAQDRLYPVYYKAFRRNGLKVIAYLWPNPLRTDMLARWTEALRDPDTGEMLLPDAIMLDFELTFQQTDAVITSNAEQSFADAQHFALPVIGYTRGYWWQTHIIRPVERGKQFIIAHYPSFMIAGQQRQLKSHAELHSFLPIDNGFTPYLGTRITKEQTIGWQVSEQGRLAPYTKDMDLDTLLLAWVNETLDDEPTPVPEPPSTAKITLSYPPNLVEVELVEV